MTFSVLTNYTADVLHFNYADNYVGVGPRNRFSSAPASERLHIKDGNLRVQNKNAANKNGYIWLGTNSPTSMAPMIEALTESDNTGILFQTQPAVSSVYGYGSKSAFRFAGLSGTGGVLSSGHLLELWAGPQWISLQLDHDGQVKLGATWHSDGFDVYHIYVQSHAHLTAGGVWTNNSSRQAKRDISPVDTAAAWDLLDVLTPVDYEYRRQERRWRLGDGREVASMDDLTETEREALAPEPFVVWTEEGSGEWHRGFIAEDLPDVLRSGDDAVAAIDIAAHNTAVLKEARARLGQVESAQAAIDNAQDEARARMGGFVRDTGAATTQWEGAVVALADRLIAAEAQAEALRAQIVREWVEIPFEEAWEEVPTATPTGDDEAPAGARTTETRYRYDAETMTVTAYEEAIAEEAEGHWDGTAAGATRRFKDGVYFDDRTGKCYIRQGGAAAAPTAG